MSSLKEDLLALKNRLDTIEGQLTGQVKEIDERDEKWKRMDEKAELIINSQTEIAKLNVGGKLFATTTKTLQNHKDTLFNKLLETGKLDLNEEIFFDRSPKLFPFILEYLRTNKINYKRFSKEDLELLKEDAEYYQILEILDHFENILKEIEFVKFEYSGPYIYGGNTAGNGVVSDLKDRSCLKGICATSPGWITIELNGEWEFDTIEVGGWRGNSSLWSSDNGNGAKILTSSDNKSFISVGTIPYGYGNSIATVKLTRSSGRYIKFEHNSYLGLGYLKINKLLSA